MSIKPAFPIYIRVVAIVMLFAMFHYMVGYRLVNSLGIICAKDEAKGMVKNNSNIKKLILTASDYSSLKWTEKNKEFSFNNEMYDVVSIQKLGNAYVVSVYCDDKETSWIASLNNCEKEIFHPDQSAKGTKSVEDIMSSFQKNYTPASEFKICIYPSVGLIRTVVAVQQHPLLTPNNIWHPPTIC
jgi:hypothetical protein